jgi:hypothetical protein
MNKRKARLLPVLALIAVIALVISASGAGYLVSRLDSQGYVCMYEKDDIPGIGNEIQVVENYGSSGVGKAIVTDGDRFAKHEVVVLIPQGGDPYKFHELEWGPNAQADLNQWIEYDGKTHHVVLDGTGEGAKTVVVSSPDSTVKVFANTTLGPAGVSPLPVPSAPKEPMPKPEEPDLPEDP